MKEQILAVQRMQDYIERNNAEEITLSDLARASLFSPWYAYRLFRDCLGLTPTEYIRKYRLTQAAKQLRTGAVKVIDAAYGAGFSNVDTFTRAFYREFGLNPGDYRKRPVPVPFFIPYDAKYRELRKSLSTCPISNPFLFSSSASRSSCASSSAAGARRTISPTARRSAAMCGAFL